MASRRSPRHRPQLHMSDDGVGMTRRCSSRLHPQIHSSGEGAVHPQIHSSEEGAGMALRRSPRLHHQIHSSGEGAGMALRRSPRLHPQIQASETVAGVTCRRSPVLHPHIHSSGEGAGMALRRSPRLHPKIQASETVAGVTCRRSPVLHPHIHSNEDGGRLTHRIRRRRRGKSPVESASLPDDDDMLREILLRLPPQPSSLPRASAICKRWRGLVTDRKFHSQFYAHHRKPPLLGVFSRSRTHGIVFNPVLNPPDRIPPVRFSLGRYSNRENYDLLDCRHGLLLFKHRVRCEVIVSDPITGEHRRLAVLPELKKNFTGAVLCAAGNQGHVHGGCHSSPFKVVLVCICRKDKHPLACVYSSETGQWGSFISTEVPCHIKQFGTRSTLVGNVLYWLFNSDRILEFDLDRQNLAVTLGPPITNDFLHGRQIIQGEDGAAGFAILAHSRFQAWQRNANCQGVFTWVPWKTVEMQNILGVSLQLWEEIRWLLGYDEDNDVIFVYAGRNIYAVQLKSMHSKKLYETDCITRIHPFTSFYTPGTTINGGSNGAEMLHDT